MQPLKFLPYQSDFALCILFLSHLVPRRRTSYCIVFITVCCFCVLSWNERCRYILKKLSFGMLMGQSRCLSFLATLLNICSKVSVGTSHPWTNFIWWFIWSAIHFERTVKFWKLQIYLREFSKKIAPLTYKASKLFVDFWRTLYLNKNPSSNW